MRGGGVRGEGWGEGGGVEGGGGLQVHVLYMYSCTCENNEYVFEFLLMS